jgi:hypothetical protein
MTPVGWLAIGALIGMMLCGWPWHPRFSRYSRSNRYRAGADSNGNCEPLPPAPPGPEFYKRRKSGQGQPSSQPGDFSSWLLTPPPDVAAAINRLKAAAADGAAELARRAQDRRLSADQAAVPAAPDHPGGLPAMTNHVIITGCDQVYYSTQPITIRCMHCGFLQWLNPRMALDDVEALLRQVRIEHRHCPPPPGLPWRFEKRRRGRGSNPPPPGCKPAPPAGPPPPRPQIGGSESPLSEFGPGDMPLG